MESLSVLQLDLDLKKKRVLVLEQHREQESLEHYRVKTPSTKDVWTFDVEIAGRSGSSEAM